jgi:hypothetical protein
MTKDQIGARHVARQRGLLPPSNGQRILTDGTIIDWTRIDRERGEGVVVGTTKDGGHFRISVPLALVGI